MPTCKEITALATDYLEDGLGAAERSLFEAHVAGCSGCYLWVKQLETTALAARALPEAEMPLPLRQELLARFDTWALRRAGAESAARPTGVPSSARSLAIPALVALAIFGLLLGLARRSSGSPRDWGIALALAVVALALPALGRRTALGAAAAAVSAAVAGALLAGGEGPVELAEGVECLLVVGAAAAAVTSVSWLLLRHRPQAPWRSAVGSWAIAGALSGVAALQVACGAHASLPHLLTFHVGGILAVVAATFSLPRLRWRPAGTAG